MIAHYSLPYIIAVQVRNSAALEALGRHAATAALHDARSAALCVRGAPLSGCQLRGVVEALRPGLLAAHPGTWGAAVRRAEEREQRGEPEDTRLMVRASAYMLCHRLPNAQRLYLLSN